MRVVVGFIMALAVHGSAFAQSTYVGGALIADIIRPSQTTGGAGGGGGEALGGALRVGTPFGEHWGVDLEFAMSAELDSAPDARLLASAGNSFTFSSTGGTTTGISLFPEIRSRQQLSTLTTMLWWRHEIGARSDIVYLGGVAFTRTETSIRYAYQIPFPLVPLPIGGVPAFPFPRAPTFQFDAIGYDAGVAVGLDGRIGMTDHLKLVPGIRLLTAAGGWVVRPAIGLHWTF